MPLEQAERTVREARNSPRAELALFDADEGGVEHCSGDQFSTAIDAMTDWVADVLQTAARSATARTMDYVAPATRCDEAYRALEADDVALPRRRAVAGRDDEPRPGRARRVW